MIHYVFASPHSYTLGIFLTHHCPALAPYIQLVDYEAFFRLPSLRGGALILTDFDRLDPDALTRAAAYHAYLSRDDSPIRVLNNPRYSLQRFDLLRRLHDAGINQFNVYRPDDRGACKFPVFLRKERDHFHILTGLLENAAHLDAAIRHFQGQDIDLSDLMIIEFLDASGRDGRFRKYGVYRVGDELYAQHCFIRDEWLVKGAPANITDADRQEHRAFIAANPHADQVTKIFEMARIDYGRMDYAVLNGKVQAFEINTNPAVLTGPPSAFNYDTRPYAELHEQAMRGLLQYGNPERTIEIPQELRAAGPVSTAQT
jgi:hypothetical protein